MEQGTWQTLTLDRERLEANRQTAASLRRRFTDSGTLVLNLIGPSGSGKTSLLERTFSALPTDSWAAAIVSHGEIEADRQRLARFGFPIKKAPNADACHLDAGIIEKCVEDLDLNELDLLLIENVSNLVCPCHYDLGETAKIMMLSVTQGPNEARKYPTLLSMSELLVLNKIDLLPTVSFSVDEAVANARRIHRGIDVILTSCSSGQGLEEWMRWLNRRASILSTPSAHEENQSQWAV